MSAGLKRINIHLDTLHPEHLQRVMRGLKSRGHFFLEGAFVISALLEADRERLERPAQLRLRQGANQARVQPARQVGGDRHVGPQAESHGIDEQIANRLHRGFLGHLLVHDREVQVPISPDG